MDPGFYWITVDGLSNDSIFSGSFALSLSCEGFATAIFCGEAIKDSTLFSLNKISDGAYENCYDDTLSYHAGDQIYRIDLPKKTLVSFSMIHDEQGNLDLFLLAKSKGNTGPMPDSCINSSLTRDGQTESIEQELSAGTYWIAIDGLVDPGQVPLTQFGTFELTLLCFDVAFNEISCEDQISSTTLNALNFYNYRDYINCLSEDESKFAGGERSYRFNLTERSNVTIQLDHLSQADFAIFLHRDSLQTNLEFLRPGTCIDYVIPGDSVTSLEQTLLEGDYWIVIERLESDLGQSEGLQAEADFSLKLSCKRNLLVEASDVSIDPEIMKDRIGFTHHGSVANDRVASDTRQFFSKLNHLEQRPLSTWSVYPNPFSAQIIVESELSFNEPTHYFLYNALGKLVMNRKLSANKVSISTPELITGIYLLVIRSQNQIEFHQLIHN